MKQVLVVGATGNLGMSIVQELMNTKQCGVRAMVRKMDDPKVKALEGMGASIVKGDLSDEASLMSATKDVHLVVSSLQGGPDVILAGQMKLLEAAAKNGVKRMIPSDFSVPFKDLSMDQHVFLGLRTKFHQDAKKFSSVKLHSIVQGAFLEMIYSPFLGLINEKEKTVNAYGTGDEPIQMTSVSDTAKFVAQVALMDDAPEDCYVAGEITSYKLIATSLSAVKGTRYTFKSLGSMHDLEEWIKTTKAKNPSNVMAYVPRQYDWAMLRTSIANFPLLNSKVKNHVKTEGLIDFISTPGAKKYS